MCTGVGKSVSTGHVRARCVWGLLSMAGMVDLFWGHGCVGLGRTVCAGRAYLVLGPRQDVSMYAVGGMDCFGTDVYGGRHVQTSLVQ